MDEELGMEAMGMMSGGGGGMDEMGVTNVPVPNFALPAVMELISMLEEEMSGGGMATEMGGEMPPMPPMPEAPMM
jgi:hypothetical protein